MRRCALLWIGLVCFMGLSTACGPSYVDTDATPKTALGLPTDFMIEDELDFEKGDIVDWKSLTTSESGVARLELRVGDPFDGVHSLRGEIIVFDIDATQFASAAIQPSTLRYDLEWKASANTQYLVKLQAHSGRAPYKMELFLAGGDPCFGVSCGDGEICEEGQCVFMVCDPPCSRGKRCEGGECVKGEAPCGGSCPKGEVCNRRRNKCVKNPCYGKRCGSNEVCRGGVCKEKGPAAAPSSGCTPPCPDDGRCSKGRCVFPPLTVTIVQAIPQGNSTLLTLNKGSKHHIQVGQTGKVKGVGAFKITEIYPYRSKAVMRKSADALGEKKTAVVDRR